MNSPAPPPLPPRPTIDTTRPRGSWLTILLAGSGGCGLAIVLTFLTMGFFGPFLLLGLAIFIVIGLQYLLWGWLFERIYRTERLKALEDDADRQSNDTA